MIALFDRRAPMLGVIVAVVLGCQSTSHTRGVPNSAGSTPVASSSTSSASPGAVRDASLPRFSSYEEALREVRRAYECEVEEVSRSSVVYGAEYCNAGRGQGYLIVNLKGREYIHAGVPEEVWEEFRDAESMGSYYASNLRGHYRLTLAR
jgi:hypothetical protein